VRCSIWTTSNLIIEGLERISTRCAVLLTSPRHLPPTSYHASSNFKPHISRIRLDIVLDGSLKSRRVGTNDLRDLLTVLEEEESGHGADGELLRNLGHLVDVELVEARIGVVVGEPTDKPC